jgi:serine/threonine-protein kinase RsbW
MNKPIITGNKIIIPSNLEYLTTVDDFIEGVLRGYGTDESIIADIAISVSELVINSINHGNLSEERKTVSLEIKKTNSDVSITITDEGGGFDPECIDDPLADENLLKDTGRGIFIVKSLMDKVDVKVTGKNTSITITKTIN